MLPIKTAIIFCKIHPSQLHFYRTQSVFTKKQQSKNAKISYLYCCTIGNKRVLRDLFIYTELHTNKSSKDHTCHLDMVFCSLYHSVKF